MEQSFFAHVLKAVRDIQESGPVYLQVGSGDNKCVLPFMVHIRCYRCKPLLSYTFKLAQ